MTAHEIEELLTCELPVRIYTQHLGHFVQASICVLHWPAAADAFLIEVVTTADSSVRRDTFYCIHRSDPSLIVEQAE